MDEVDDFGDLYADLDENYGSDTKLKDLDLTDEENSSDDGIGDANGAVDLGDGIMDRGENSESEDDLRIVLNEDEDSRLSHGNEGMVVRRNDEEDDEDLIILDGSDRVNKDQRNGLVQGRMHAGPHLAAFSCNSRTPLSERGDWNQSMVQHKGGISCNAGISVAAQKGYSFFLPRNRTIFDINIEALEQKPWRQSGVDITDFFNFDLEEESWKSYCQQLDHFRQQVMMSAQFLGDESSRMNQESAYELKSIKSRETTQFGLGGRNSSAMENEEKGLKRLEKPKGRAIQVENGTGERIPSMGIRRLRERDSDVVIHINIEGLMDNLSSSDRIGPEHAERDDFNCSAVKYENESSERIPLVDGGNKCGNNTNLTLHNYPEQWEDDEKGAALNIEAKLIPRRVSSRVDSRVLEDGSASDDFLVDGSCPSDLDGPSRELMDGNYLKQAQGSDKEKSLDEVNDLQESVTSDCNLSNGSRDNADKAKQESKRSDGYRCALSPGDHCDSSLTRPRSRDELCIPRKGEKDCTRAFGMCRNDMNHIKSKRIKEMLFKDSRDAGGLVSSDRRTKTTPSCKRKIYAAANRNKRSTRSSRSSSDHITFFEQKCEQRDWLLDKEDASRTTKSKHTRENVDEPTAVHGSFMENDLHLWHKKAGYHYKMEDEPAEYIDEYRHRGPYLWEKHEQHISSCNWEDEIFDHKAYCAREIRSSERDGYGHRSYERAESSDNNLRYLEHRMLDSPRYHILDERREVDASFLGQQSTWKSSERSVDYVRLSNAREIQSKNKSYKHSFVRSRMGCHHSYFEDDSELETDMGIFSERNVLGDALFEKRCDGLAKKRFYVDKEVPLRDFSSSNLSCGRRSSSSEADKLASANSINLYDYQLDNSRKEISKEGSTDCYGSRHCNYVSHNFDEKRHDFSALERKEAVNIHLNGWKRKFPGEVHSIKARSGKDKSRTALDKEWMHPRRKEASPSISRLERSYTYLKVNKVKDSRLDDLNNSSRKKILDDNPISRVHEDDEIEEGQLIEESEVEDVISKLKGHKPTKVVVKSLVEVRSSVSSKEKILHSKDYSSKNGINDGCDKNRILEMLAKMEKRRERFKEPITLKNGPEESDKASLDIPATIAIDEVKQQRPARKRQWGTS